jgi:ribosome biogenesis GTPase
LIVDYWANGEQLKPNSHQLKIPLRQMQSTAMERKGIVIRSTGSWSNVLLDDGSVWECRLRGHFRTKGLRTTNPVAVGDAVTVIAEPEQPLRGVITELDDRRNYVVRKSVNLSKEAHVIAANIDLMVVLATVHMPRTSFGFIDRLLVTAEAYGIPAMVVLNKSDLCDTPELQELLQEYVDIYTHIGYAVRVISAEQNLGIEDLQAALKDRTSLITGHSGVGKSTLINALCPELDLRVGDISEVHSKGTHTTTFAEMFALRDGGFIIDTPGIKEFGLIDMKEDHLGHYFPEMFRQMKKCRFGNCHHVNEPGCAVISAVESGDIPVSRYNSYLGMLENRQ